MTLAEFKTYFTLKGLDISQVRNELTIRHTTKAICGRILESYNNVHLDMHYVDKISDITNSWADKKRWVRPCDSYSKALDDLNFLLEQADKR